MGTVASSTTVVAFAVNMVMEPTIVEEGLIETQNAKKIRTIVVTERTKSDQMATVKGHTINETS